LVKRVLRLPAYRRLLAAYTLNELAWSLGALALAVLVYRRTGSVIGSAAFFLCSQFFPALISPALVARLDQRAPRRVLPALYALEGVLFLLLALAASRFSLVPVLALALADGIVAASARALARAATVDVLTPAGLLREGNALTNGAFSICFMAGPALGGVVVVAGGTIAALLVTGALFAVIAVLLVTADGFPGAVFEKAPAAGRLRAAIGHVMRDPGLRALLSVQAAALVFFTISIPIEVVFAQTSLHAGAGGYAVLLSTWGAGAVAGSAVYARWRRGPTRVLIAGGAAALGIGFVVMAIAPSLLVAAIGSALAGAGNGVESVAARTAVQERTPERLMALVMSLNESITEAAPGLGIVLGGSIATLSGPRVAFAVAGAGALAITGVAWIVLAPGDAVRPRCRQEPDDSSPPSGTLAVGAVSSREKLA
jgi:predicted MFS family arabinose efflux permease